MAEIPAARVGRCTVCDHFTVFVTRDRNTKWMRDRARCVRCRSRGRNRHVALLARDALGLASLGAIRDTPTVRVLNTSDRAPIGRQLANLDHVTNTGYWPQQEFGTLHDGVRNEDLTSLTFDDGTFDLVVTEDVMEHIPDSHRAFEEIHRVLKPGGVHVFSIPYRIDQPSRARFTMIDGEPRLEEPILFHTDPGRGRIPVFHDFGYTLLEDLDTIGFTTRIVRSQHRDLRRYGIIDCTTFLSRRARAR